MVPKFVTTGHPEQCQPSPRTLRFYARINGHYVSVLVDIGSSHNIIQPRVATFLRLPTQNLPSFTVMVGNGAHLKCDGLCTDVPLTVAEHCFVVSLYVFCDCMIPIFELWGLVVLVRIQPRQFVYVQS